MKKSKKSLIGWQTGDTFLCVISNLILLSYSAMIISGMCMVRNILAYFNKLSKTLTIILLSAGAVIGLWANNRGVVGWLPVIASAEYTTCMYLFKSAQEMRYALIANLLMWLIHDAYIQSYPMAGMDFGLSLWTVWQTLKNRGSNQSKPRARK